MWVWYVCGCVDLSISLSVSLTHTHTHTHTHLGIKKKAKPWGDRVRTEYQLAGLRWNIMLCDLEVLPAWQIKHIHPVLDTAASIPFHSISFFLSVNICQNVYTIIIRLFWIIVLVVAGQERAIGQRIMIHYDLHWPECHWPFFCFVMFCFVFWGFFCSIC